LISIQTARRKRAGKIGRDIYNPKKFRAEKRRSGIQWLKITGCSLLFFLPILLILVGISLVEKAAE
jgi:hypothetical protein